MKKIYKFKDLDCANCAAKMERGIAAIDGVESCSVSFMSQRLTIEADESRIDEIAAQAAKICKKVDSDCELIIK